ncbi:MAG: IclR family transcriptional regulator [Acidobacteriaceae bacterium]
MSRKTPTTYSVPALDKGLDIVEALAAAEGPQSLTDLSRSLKRTPSELFRMLNALERRNYITRDPISDGYRLTLRLYELAHTHSPVDQLLAAAGLHMRELADAVHESCHLSVLSGPMLLVIAQAESPEPVRLSIEVGYRTQPLNTASGRVLIAWLAEPARQRFLDADPTHAQMSVQERKALAADLAQIRRSGYLMALSTRRTGYDICCPVGNPHVGVTAALAVPVIPGGANSGRERQLIHVVQRYAKAITEALGLTPLRLTAEVE